MSARPRHTWVATSILLLSLATTSWGCGSDEEAVAVKAPAWAQATAEGAAPLPAEVKGQWFLMGTQSTPKSVSVGSTVIQGEFGYSDRNFTNLKAVEGTAGPIPTEWQGVWFSAKTDSKILMVSSSTLLGGFGYSDKHYQFLEGSHADGVVTITSGRQGQETVSGTIELLDEVLVISIAESSSHGNPDTVAGQFVRKGHEGPKSQGRVLRVVDGSVSGTKAYGAIEQVGKGLMLSLVSHSDYSVDAYGGMTTKSKKQAYVQAFGGRMIDPANLEFDKLFHTGAFDIRAIIALIKQGKHQDLSALEKVINDVQSGINNVDLDKDGKVDFVGIDESREGKTVVLSFMAFPSAKPDDKPAKTLVGEIAISPEGTATTETKTADGKVVTTPSKMTVSGQHPDYAQGSEKSAYEDGWDTSDTAKVAGGVGGGLLLGYLLTRNRPMYGGYGYNHYRNRGYRNFRNVSGPSNFYNRNRRFRDDNGMDSDDGYDERKRKNKRKLKKQKSKLLKKHKQKAAKQKKARAAQAKKATAKAKRSKARSVRKASRSRGSRRGK